MKKLTAFLAAMAALGLLTACGSSKEAEEAETAKPSEIEEAAESEPQEELPAAAEYTSADGMYKVTLLEGLEQTDLQFQSNSSMMGLDAVTDRQGFSAV